MTGGLNIVSEEFGGFPSNTVSDDLTGGFLGSGSGSGFAIFDKNMNYLYSFDLDSFIKEVNYYIEIIIVKRSKDSGFYGIAYVSRGNGKDYYQVFKCDKNGKIYFTEDNYEQQQAIAIVPNPASGSISFNTPFKQNLQLALEFYTTAGKKLMAINTQSNTAVNIQALATGIYFVKATILNTGEQRIIKLIVE